MGTWCTKSNNTCRYFHLEFIPIHWVSKPKYPEIGKEIDIASSTGEFIGVSKVVKSDVASFNEILVDLIDDDRQNYYDFAYKTLSNKTTIDYVLTNGLKWTEIDDYNDWKIANELVSEFEN